MNLKMYRADTVAFLEQLVPVRPGAKALGVAQDRIKEKQLARELGAMTADFASGDIRCIELLAADVPGLVCPAS